MYWLKIFNRAAAGLLTILLSSCTSFKAPKTLFITYQAAQRDFQVNREQIQSVFDKYTKAFQRSNPDTRIVYITYTSSEFFNQIEQDSRLNLGPDLVMMNQYSAAELLARDLTVTLPNKPYFDEIYSPRIQLSAKANDEYTFAPWLLDIQIACYNKTTIKEAPNTIQELEELSASGIKFGISSDPYELIWTAGTQGAISEISAVGNRTTTDDSTYPAIQKWLKWLRKAAIYQHIYFLGDSVDLTKKLKNNELDWVTCWGTQLEDLKKTMGDKIGVAALPNSSTSRAFPTYAVYGFALGKNSSQSQREMAIKFVKTSVNTVAQRKLQLDDIGFLAANQNVAIPPESSKNLSAIDTSFNDQNNYYSKEWPGVVRWLLPEENNLEKSWGRYIQLRGTLIELTDGYLNINEAIKRITTTKES